MTANQKTAAADPGATRFRPPTLWEYSAPLIGFEKRDRDASHAQKDPTIVYHNGKWHCFMTIRTPSRVTMEYCAFDKWENADKAPRTILELSTSQCFCAPQVFYFTPHKKWYLVYQNVLGEDAAEPGASRKRFMQVAYSTTDNIEDPASWTPLQSILDAGPTDCRSEGGLDYWIICDDTRAYLFFTNLHGKLFRMWTRLEDFPHNFGHCEVALEGPFFEASHTYRLKGLNQYLTLIEEYGDRPRHYKAYLADKLDGPWTALADTWEKPFAGAVNIQPAAGVEEWTDNISHGEFLRESNAETLTIDPDNLQFLFQGMLEADKAGRKYGEFQWRIGLLRAVKSP
jgi:hypothetical protein